MNDCKEWGILTSMLVAAVMWVQVPQWADDIAPVQKQTVVQKLQEQ